MSNHGSNLETVSHFSHEPGYTYDEKMYLPLSKEEVIVAVTAVITQHVREQQGLPPELDPQVVEFIDRYIKKANS